MPYQSDDDPLVETLNSAVWHVIGLTIGVALAAIVFVWQQVTGRQTSPDTLEGTVSVSSATSERREASDHTGLVFLFGMGGTILLILGLLTQGTFSHVSILVGILGLAAALWASQSFEAAPSETVVQSNEPLAAHRRYRIVLPRGESFEPEPARKLMEYLLRTSVHLALQIVAEHQSMRWEITDWRSDLHPDFLLRAVHAHYPKAEVEWYEDEEVEEAYPYYRYVIFYRQAAEFVWPIKYVEDLRSFDPLAAITQAMADLQPGERITYTVALSLHAEFAYKLGEKLITASPVNPLEFVTPTSLYKLIDTATTRQARVERYASADQALARGKLSRPLYQCFLSVMIDSPAPERVQMLAAVDNHIWQFVREPYNALMWDEEPWPSSIRRIDTAEQAGRYHTLSLIYQWASGAGERWRRTRLILSPEEIASLWHLPHKGFAAREIQWVDEGNVVAPAAAVHDLGGVVIGVNVHAGQLTPIVLSDADRAQHVYVVGKTGVGKSTTLHHIITQDIQAGEGVGVIDPHGSLVRSILRSSIPPEREDDVVLVDFAQTEYPAPLNPFAVPQGVPRDTAVSQVMGLLKKIYAEDWSRTRMENVLYSALVALMDEEHATPRDISRIMMDAEYRTELLQRVKDPVALEYWWDEYDRMSEAMQAQVREPVLNRIRIFYRNSAVRNMVCHPHRLDFKAILDEGKIFLANLNSDETHSEQANLGAMLITDFQMAAMTRRADENAAIQPFYLFVEEVQQFVTTALPVVFSEARKFGLSLTAANQYLGQLKGSTLEAILGNAGAAILFACGPEDARALSGYLKPSLTPDHLMSFDRFQAAVKMQVGGKSVPAFTIQTLPPLEEPPDADEREARIREKSIQNYTPWTRQEVEAWLEARYDHRLRQRPRGAVSDFD
ncbi:MAG TPA: type IV secretion system DNA-binding domain-containing protein [Bellilinea sp.]|nr:type IV secretion system DNA-binding domain-containing protein [Bellilinea sp.]